MDKYTVKMFPQAYRDIDKIYEQALLVSNYADDAIALAEKPVHTVRNGRRFSGSRSLIFSRQRFLLPIKRDSVNTCWRRIF